jgi:CheY-like chemotaxis protein
MTPIQPRTHGKPADRTHGKPADRPHGKPADPPHGESAAAGRPININASKARVLIATANVSDGDQLSGALRDHFEFVAVSLELEHAARDFQAQQPDVLVLGFETIEEAQRYYLGMFRVAPALQLRPHRTVLLCSKDELAKAFALCKEQYFDDYVLYWPLAYDGLRLPMSIWIACREMMALQAAAAPRPELRAHAQHMQTLEQTLDQEISSAEDTCALARDSMVRLEQEIANSHDEFARQVRREGVPGSAADHAVLSKEMARMKRQQLQHARLAREIGLEPVSAWAAQLRARVEPALRDAGALAGHVRELRTRLLVVDDDAMTRELLAGALRDEPYELEFASDGPDAIQRLRRSLPDLILMDFHLPGLDGISLTRRLKASPALGKIPVIVMTGDSRRETVKSSIEAGAGAFIVKPFNRASLKKKLEEVLARS